ncbi:MAG: bifunctional DNA-formamidopyrimidine glycosylase/DNA-(apurinic or apyrimidinic site) lyase [Gammaproteobacteria bacterium]|nr:bifunctional DNA-formamidopyrimidine glycosylase/DNA-(apurinic or apyrimidinic site) lyase [Gammaproteobacteria bacterium]
MPELPEVETIRRGLEPLVGGKTIAAVKVRDHRLRWPVPADLNEKMRGQPLTSIGRRAKYLLWNTPTGTCLVHLGMSGSLRVIPQQTPLHTHDHVCWQLSGGQEIRLRDPRRFGSVLWTEEPLAHPLLASLGPEPLGNEFNADLLYSNSRGRKSAVKNFIMDARQVVGVGNIYASESLFRSAISPLRAAGRISKGRYEHLAVAIRTVLQEAVHAGGTTLRDFARDDGSPGYFAHSLAVYGKEGSGCTRCGGTIKRRVIGQRSTFYCPGCQT